MFIRITSQGYNRDGEQFSNGLFLMVFSDHNDHNDPNYHFKLKAIVRSVKMKQLGHWMMANLMIGGRKMVLSGSYGCDGSPIHLPTKFGWNKEWGDKLLPHLVDVPIDLQEAFWNGGGHNCAGNEAPLFRKWALENLKILQKPIKKL